MVETLIDAQKVIEIHDVILQSEPGLHGDLGENRLEGALSRITNKVLYEGMDDVFEIGAMYAVAFARGHVFNDANKRTGLVTALTYLSIQGIDIPRTKALEDIMVDVAEGKVEYLELADMLYSMHDADEEDVDEDADDENDEA